MLGSIPHKKYLFIIYIIEDEQELSLGMLIHLHRIYIFDCFRPIFYNFHILLATFYIIFGTNILIQCLVLVPVCCMFFVLQNIHNKRSPNAIEIYRELFYNICDFWEVESTQTEAHGLHYPLGRGQPPGTRWCLVGTP